MMRGVPILAVPVLIALLFWWWGFRKTGRFGKSLPIFLLGYSVLLIINGADGVVHRWGRSSRGILDYVSIMLVFVLLSYLFGGIAFLVLAAVKEDMSELLRWLTLESDEAADSHEAAGGAPFSERLRSAQKKPTSTSLKTKAPVPPIMTGPSASQRT